jgi:branched-chain amino acid transport system permease protein
MYMVLTVNWTVFCGPTQYFSLGIAAFFGVGVYMASIVWEVRPDLPLLIVIILAGVASSFLALLVGLTTLRIKGIYFAIFTFGLSELLRHFVMWWEVNKTGTVGRWIPIIENDVVYRYMVVLAAVTILGAYILRRSRYGLAMTSIGDGQEVARHMGVNTSAVNIMVFAATCFLTGVAGALIATRWSYIDADVAFDPIRTVLTIMMSLFGGMSVLYGPIMGTVILGLVSDVVLVKFPYLSRLFLGLILVLTVMFIPEGIAGLIAGKNSVGIRGRLSDLKNMFFGNTEKE